MTGFLQTSDTIKDIIIGLFGSISLTIFIIIILLLILLAILWFVLPFAVFGIKKRMDKLNKNLIEISKVLRSIESQNRQGRLVDDYQGKDLNIVENFAKKHKGKWK